MKRTLCSLALLTLCVAPLAARDANRILLRVNDRIATLYDYEFRRDEQLRAIQAADLDPARRAELMEGIGAEVMGNILDELLVLSRADQIGYTPTEREIAQAMEDAKQNFGIQNDDQFQQALAASGMTMENFQKQVTVNLRVSQVMGREVQERVDLDEEDLRRYYQDHPDQFTTPEQLQLQEIVVLDSSALTAERRAELAETLRQAIEAGTAMADLAAEYEEEGTTSGVVELGWIEQGDLDAALEEAVWDLPAGSVSAAVEGRGGLHILEVSGREAETLLEFAEVAAAIDQKERQRLLMVEYEAYLNELRDAAYIRIANLPADAQGFNIQESASRLTLESEMSSVALGLASEDLGLQDADPAELAIDTDAVILEPDGRP